MSPCRGHAPTCENQHWPLHIIRCSSHREGRTHYSDPPCSPGHLDMYTPRPHAHHVPGVWQVAAVACEQGECTCSHRSHRAVSAAHRSRFKRRTSMLFVQPRPRRSRLPLHLTFPFLLPVLLPVDAVRPTPCAPRARPGGPLPRRISPSARRLCLGRTGQLDAPETFCELLHGAGRLWSVLHRCADVSHCRNTRADRSDADNAHPRAAAYAGTLRMYYPYAAAGGRYSNGPVAVEYMVQNIGTSLPRGNNAVNLIDCE